MNKKRLAAGAVGLAMVVGLVLAIGDTEARHRGRISGEFTMKGTGTGFGGNTLIDTDGDGRTAGFDLGNWKSTRLGTGTTQHVGEWGAFAPATCDGRSGMIQGTLVMGRGVAHQDSSGDLFYGKDTSGTLCIDPSAGTFSVSWTAVITGGTGRFEGATGSFKGNGRGRTLFSDGKGHSFGVSEWTITGTIDTP